MSSAGNRRNRGRRAVLALGSGGARGYAHIGVIQEVQARGYQICAISGCSMGAVIGGMYAAGHLPEYSEWVTTLGYLDLLRMLDLTWRGSGTIRASRVMGYLGRWLKDLNIEDLPIPFTSVATDLVRQREVWFQQGSLMQAIRASIAIPGLITPVKLDGALLVDGGIVNPLPILPTLSAPNDLVIAVNVTALSPQNVGYEQLMPIAKREPEPLPEVAPRSLLSWPWRKGNATSKENDADLTERTIGSLELMLRSFEVTQASLASYKIAGSPPDVLVEVPKTVCGAHEFHRAKQMIQLGQHLTAQALDRYEEGISGHRMH